jgi:hypothetical protein
MFIRYLSISSYLSLEGGTRNRHHHDNLTSLTGNSGFHSWQKHNMMFPTVKIFHTSRNHLQILGTRREILSKFHTEDARCHRDL